MLDPGARLLSELERCLTIILSSAVSRLDVLLIWPSSGNILGRCRPPGWSSGMPHADEGHRL